MIIIVHVICSHQIGVHSAYIFLNQGNNTSAILLFDAMKIDGIAANISTYCIMLQIYSK